MAESSSFSAGAGGGRPTGVPWVASIPDRVEGGSYRIGGFLPEVGSYLVVVRGAELRTRGTVEASLTLATLVHRADRR